MPPRSIVLLVPDAIAPSWMGEFASSCLCVAEEDALSNTLKGEGVAADLGEVETKGMVVHDSSKVVVSDSVGIVESDPTLVFAVAFVISTLMVATLSSHDLMVAFPVPFR